MAGIGEDVENDPTQAPIIKLVQAMIAEAVRSRASDIHIEPMKDRVRVRYRIDGECVERDKIPLRMKGPLISRLKIMAGIDIAEKRLPQDGRIKLTVDKQQHRLPRQHAARPTTANRSCCVSCAPTASASASRTWASRRRTTRRSRRSSSAPTASSWSPARPARGKTTTLYGALNELNRPDRKIITAEDPVEYNFAGINQCQVKDGIGLTFSKILRAMLRQAPNIILVGEIRDLEVAEVAIQAALTGHLVFSTLHTNDAPGAITRLIDMGVKPFLVASSIQAVMAQRLIRVLCPKCKQPDTEPDPMWLKLAGIKEDDIEGQERSTSRAGCEFCNGIGFRGRIGIFEMMQMNSEIREPGLRARPDQQDPQGRPRQRHEEPAARRPDQDPQRDDDRGGDREGGAGRRDRHRVSSRGRRGHG